MTTRVFMPGGALAHVLPWNASPNEKSSALCGRSPWPGLWYGTGSQDEYEKAASLPVCAGCLAKTAAGPEKRERRWRAW